jgi:hypothetical protein
MVLKQKSSFSPFVFNGFFRHLQIVLAAAKLHRLLGENPSQPGLITGGTWNKIKII